MEFELALNDGAVLPALGLGVFQSPPAETTLAVQSALEAGYRLIDTAAIYGNEREVGEGIRRSGVAREEIVVESKVWVSDFGYEETLHAWRKSAVKLGVERIDLFILHQPAPDRFERTVGAYRALERLRADGRVGSIGVSNFTPAHLRALMASVDTPPAVNQVELHPYFSQAPTRAANEALGAVTQAWSPIGGITFYPGYGDGRVNVMQDPVLVDIADAHAVTPAQVMLRWHLQQGRSAIPKSVNPARIAQNRDVLGFELTADELARIDALDTGVRSGPDPDEVRADLFARPIPEA